MLLRDAILKMQPGDQHIAFCLPNSPEMLCWLIACFHLGVPVTPIIYEQPAEFIEQVLQLIQPRYFLVTTEKFKTLAKIKIPVGCQVNVIDETSETIVDATRQPDNIQASTISPDKLAMIIFSSGTSGHMKGIMHSYQSAYGFIDLLYEVLAATEKLTYLVAQPMGHIGGIVTTLLALFKNGTAILLENFEINQYMQMMQQYQPTHLNLHTPLFYSIINYPTIDKKSFSRVITSFAGGDDLPADLPEQYTEKTGAPMQTGYGMTETGIVIQNRNPYGKYKGSAGTKLHHSAIELRDEKSNAVPLGAVGEIWVKSPACCIGYWNMPELNKTTFVDGWFRTGDLAFQDVEHHYWYQGRASSVIHCGEHILYPATIEQVLFHYPLIKAAAVIGVPDEKRSEVPVAFVELKNPNAKNDILQQAIQDYVATHFQPWQMPIAINIVDALPLGLTGKIDREQLKKMWLTKSTL